MKLNIKILIVPLIIAVISASCLKDVSLDPLTFRPITYTSEAQLAEQVAGMYNILEQDQLYAQGLWGYLTAGADESFRANVSNSNIFTELYNISNTENNVWQFWRNLYKGIEDANIILDVADKPEMDESKRTWIKGQATFLRAYYFYLLALHFGDVPLKNKLATEYGTNFNLPRTPVKEVYDFVVSEMVKAEAMVQTIPQVQTTTIVTQSAVQAILARVCLTLAGQPYNDNEKYKEALGWAQKLINSNIHSLNPNYATVFINNMQNNMNDKNIREGIWDAAFLSKSNTTGSYAATAYLVTQQLGAVMGVYSPDASPTAVIGYSPGTYRAFPKLYNSYSSGDLRRDIAIAPYVYKNSSTTKYYTLTVNITGGGGSGATATAYTNSMGTITSVVIDNPGSGYTSAPSISFTSYGTNTTTTPSVTGANVATATATVSGGKLTAINITFGGLGYPTVYDRCVGKWRREYEVNLPPSRMQNNTSCNFPIIRYADVLLMAAEADLKVNGTPSASAVEYYNKVRRRAFGYDPNAAVPGFDVTSFTLQDIMDERSRELCFEGQRRNDLIRWGVMTTVMQNLVTDNANRAPATYLTAANVAATNFITAPEKYVLFPIPGGEIILDRALTQNPGW
jgi:hypothetical protein